MKENDENIFNAEIARLEWACRRGMLELDVLLGNFLKEVYSTLSSSDKEHFKDLLNYPDPVLFNWLMGTEAPEDINLLQITEKIRNHARSRI